MENLNQPLKKWKTPFFMLFRYELNFWTAMLPPSGQCGFCTEKQNVRSTVCARTRAYVNELPEHPTPGMTHSVFMPKFETFFLIPQILLTLMGNKAHNMLIIHNAFKIFKQSQKHNILFDCWFWLIFCWFPVLCVLCESQRYVKVKLIPPQDDSDVCFSAQQQPKTWHISGKVLSGVSSLLKESQNNTETFQNKGPEGSGNGLRHWETHTREDVPFFYISNHTHICLLDPNFCIYCV